MLAVATRVDISAYWPNGDDGQPLSVNSVYQRYLNTDLQVTYQTLDKALKGELESAKIANISKLAAICSDLSGQRVIEQDLLK